MDVFFTILSKLYFMQLYISAIIHLCKFCIYELLYFSNTLVVVLQCGESRESSLLGRVLRGENPKRGSGEGHTSGRARRGEAAPLAVLRQSLSGVQRGHSGTHKGWHNP